VLLGMALRAAALNRCVAWSSVSFLLQTRGSVTAYDTLPCFCVIATVSVLCMHADAAREKFFVPESDHLTCLLQAVD
jgi:hypothetical protein